MQQNAVRFSLCAGALVMSVTGPAWAEACVGSAVAVDEAITERAPDLRDRVRDALAAEPSIDRCARVRLGWHAGTIRVAVTLADGRATERTLTHESDVLPTLAALLVLPKPSEGPAAPSDESAPAAAAAPQKEAEPITTPPAAAPLVSKRLEVPLAERDDVAASNGASASHVRMELSAVTGVRAGTGQVSFGYGALSLLEVSGWLVGFAGRADRYYARGPGDSSGGVLELALLGGRRLHAGNTAFDLLIGPAAVLQGTTTVASASDMGRMVTESSSSTAARLVLGARASFFARSTLHPFIGFDGEVGPARAGDTDIPEAPRLPLWTIGLSTGLTVGT